MSTRRTIYLDYNATTPLDPQVRTTLVAALDEPWANPSSIHHLGRRARALLDDARDRVAMVWKCRPSEVIFTSGGTEANNLAVLGAARRVRDRGRHLVCSAVEHPAVLACHEFLAAREGFSLTRLPVDASGRTDPAELIRALRPDTVLVSVMAANNETGVLQPVAELGRICRERGILFHTDAVQCLGKKPFAGMGQFEADLVTCCGHKIHGPRGVGALYMRSPLLADPLILGGSHELERRAGTENLPAILAFSLAIERFLSTPVFPEALLRPLRDRLAARCCFSEGISVAGAAADRLANTLALTVPGADSLGLLANLDLEGVCASSGSACSSGSPEPSHVLAAMGYPSALAASLVRFSLGRESSSADIDIAAEAFIQAVRRVQSC